MKIGFKMGPESGASIGGNLVMRNEIPRAKVNSPLHMNTKSVMILGD